MSAAEEGDDETGHGGGLADHGFGDLGAQGFQGGPGGVRVPGGPGVVSGRVHHERRTSLSRASSWSAREMRAASSPGGGAKGRECRDFPSPSPWRWADRAGGNASDACAWVTGTPTRGARRARVVERRAAGGPGGGGGR